MSSPRGLAPLLELQSRLQQISTSGGYNTNAGGSVYLGRRLIDAHEAPFITVTQSDEEEADVEVTASLLRRTTPYLIQGLIEADKNNPFLRGYELLADMDRAIWQATTVRDERLADTATRVEYRGSRVEQAEDGSAYALARINLDITHSERLGDPGKAD